MDKNEITRLTRTAVQALVAMLVTQAANLGIEVDQGALMLVVFPPVMAITTGLVAKLEAIPQVGALLILLNGPRRKPAYSAEAQAEFDAMYAQPAPDSSSGFSPRGDLPWGD